MQTAPQVCRNLPWPFRAIAGDCDGCTYDCSSGTFSCKSCNCKCNNEGPPYDRDSSRPYNIEGSPGFEEAHNEYSGAGMQSRRGIYTCDGPKACLCSPAVPAVRTVTASHMTPAANNV
jgi:hypothetical protein